jgi:hypothetical protein
MNPKLRRAGFMARGLDEAAICQIAHDMSDGFISAVTVESLAIAHRCLEWREVVAALVAVGRWIPADKDGEDGWELHDYLEFNPSKAEWKATQEERRESGRKGGQARAKANAQAKPEATAKAKVQANAQADPTRPDKDFSTVSCKKTSAAETVAGEEETESDKLVIFWLTGCRGQQAGAFKVKDLLEARAAIEFLRRFMAERAIEEQIGYIANGKIQPGSVNYLITACRRWGMQNGVQVPPYILATRAPPGDFDFDESA